MAKGIKTGGRKKGVGNKSTADVKAIAQCYAPAAIAELARLSTKAESETARVSAIDKLLDRAYGRPAQVIAGDKENPVEVIFGFRDALRAKLARLAQSRSD